MKKETKFIKTNNTLIVTLYNKLYKNKVIWTVGNSWDNLNARTRTHTSKQTKKKRKTTGTSVNIAQFNIESVM